MSQAVAERKIDLTRMSQDQQAFIAQRDLPGGIRTLLAWYWKQEGDAYDAQQRLIVVRSKNGKKRSSERFFL